MHSMQFEPADSQSGISPREKALSDAIAKTLQAPLDMRVAVFKSLAKEIEAFIHTISPDRPWTCTTYIGTDKSHIFRGGTGLSIVIDTQGRLWRARSHEDFDTTYVFTRNDCLIDTLTPLYHQMREYLPR